MIQATRVQGQFRRVLKAQAITDVSSLGQLPTQDRATQVLILGR